MGGGGVDEAVERTTTNEALLQNKHAERRKENTHSN